MLSYSLLERIHYLLVAGFDVRQYRPPAALASVHGLPAHGGQFNSGLAAARRARAHPRLLVPRRHTASTALPAAQAEATPETNPLRSGEPQRELYGLLKSHLAPVLDTRHDLASLSDHPLARDLPNLAALRGAPG